MLAGVVVIVLAFVAFGTRVVPNDDESLQGVQAFDAAVYGPETFPAVAEAIEGRAVPAAELAAAIAADPAAAAEEYAVQSSGGPVYSTTLTGVVGEGASGIVELDVEGLPDDLLVRVQLGPAINGTELRDASGEIQFGQFTNQIEFQDAAAAINDTMKAEVLGGVDAAALAGSTVTLTGAFTLINPQAWLITPVEFEVA
ncbi:lipoprotein [Arenivirga flava]|uniref:Lipoprotein n=1 Tax=Arenivirga flava TaxID=1930060 RepID=A0AA37UPG7_9MICO|nr:lipoprotein [Arenivirga flava]